MGEKAEQKEPVFWCDCLTELIGFFPKVDKALGIMRWAKEKGYTKPTSGAVENLKEAEKDLHRIIWNCNLNEKAGQAHDKLVRSHYATIDESISSVEDARRLVWTAISEECRKQRLAKPLKPLKLLPKGEES
jgi:hypothetical protein